MGDAAALRLSFLKSNPVQDFGKNLFDCLALPFLLARPKKRERERYGAVSDAVADGQLSPGVEVRETSISP